MEALKDNGTCPKCGAPIEIEPDEKSDGTILGYGKCSVCDWSE